MNYDMTERRDIPGHLATPEPRLRQGVVCPACGGISSNSTEVQFHQASRGRKVWHYCLDCKAFFDPDRYDKESEVVHTQDMAWGASDSGKELNTFKIKMYLSVLQLLRKHCPPPATLLDVGCGYGGFLVEAKGAGYKVSGFDILPEAVAYVGSRGIPTTLSFSIKDVQNIPDESLDIVTCLDCNCYWPDQRAELQSALAKLKYGGYLAMRVVDKSWLFSLGLSMSRLAPKRFSALLIESVNDHRFSMPVGSLLELLRSCGFSLVHASPYGALHSDKSRWAVKLAFHIGGLIWKMTGKFTAPGAVILAKKPSS